ncbi:MAG: NUDIX hydrolase [Solirubrobacterales bacterium]
MSERVRGAGERLNLGTPTTPRPAASIVLLRRGGRHAQRKLEVLMLRRTDQAHFMPGIWVFPGGSVDPGDGDGDAGFRACAVRELAEEAAIELPPGEELVPFCRWITPEYVATRFDAWFYLALAPAHAPPQPDGVEVTAAAWHTPAAALAAHEAGELPLAFPTLNQLRMLLPYRTSNEAIDAYRGLNPEPVLPRVVGEGDRRRVVLPGDPAYDDQAAP